MSTILRDTCHIARKVHYCDLCCGQIKVGSPYHHRVFIADGELYTNKEHEDCRAAIEAALDHYDIYNEDDLSYDNLSDYIIEMYIERHGSREGKYFHEIVESVAKEWQMKQVKDAIEQLEEE